jgi:hypothetical protein
MMSLAGNVARTIKTKIHSKFVFLNPKGRNSLADIGVDGVDNIKYGVGMKIGFNRLLIENSCSLTNKIHGTESFLRSGQSLSYAGISQHFMEPEGS